MAVIRLEEGARFSQVSNSIHTWKLSGVKREDLTISFTDGNPKGDPFNDRCDDLIVKFGSKILLYVNYPKIYWWSATDE